ncbi:MAG: outer membrane protein transport protein, partial [Candidatus Omnitrophota bacterium]
PRDWHSSLSYGMGIEYKLNDFLKLRGGYFFHETPIPEANFDTALPDASSNTITLGAGINLNKNTTLDFGYAAVFYLPRKINNTIGSASGASINGKYKSFINVYALTLTFKI